MSLYLFSGWEISLSFLAFSTNSTFANFLFVSKLSVLSISIFAVSFKFLTETSTPAVQLASVWVEACLLAFTHPRAFTPFSEFISVLLLFVTVPSPFPSPDSESYLSFVSNVTV